MDKKIHNKLVRDKIPAKLTGLNLKFETSILDDEEYVEAMKAKLIKESQELVEAESREDVLKEFADVLIVLDHLTTLYDINDEEMSAAIETNYEKKGGLDDNIYLHWVEDNGY